ncbi:MAG: hypothetical protein AB7U82_04010 [Blastocatellales bacterium]
MAIFDQRGQQVIYQYIYNAAGDINFGSVQSNADAVAELQKLQSEVRKARDAGAIDEDTATDVAYDIEKAANQAKKEGADKNSAIGYLEKAKTLLEGFSTAAGLVKGLSGAIEMIGRLF